MSDLKKENLEILAATPHNADGWGLTVQNMMRFMELSTGRIVCGLKSDFFYRDFTDVDELMRIYTGKGDWPSPKTEDNYFDFHDSRIILKSTYDKQQKDDSRYEIVGTGTCLFQFTGETFQEVIEKYYPDATDYEFGTSFDSFLALGEEY